MQNLISVLSVKPWMSLWILVLLALATPESARADGQVRFFGAGETPVLEPGNYDPSIPTPESVLGFPLGEKPARHAQVLDYFDRLAAASDRIKVFRSGSTYESRPLIYAVITDKGNMARLDSIKADLHRIADPRQSSGSSLQTLIDKTPAVAWLAYSIHGDEVSGVDASLAVAYHLVAGNDSLTARLRRELVVIIDPVENPDGRERFLAQMESFAAAVPHADGQSLQRGGFWPWGRGNHYLFDMNRDWFAQELPESKARIEAITDWKPQLLVDAHEMGQWDTYLFSPPRHPFSPQISDRMKEWWNRFAADQAAAFDRQGWAYYTREWNEEWYPGYGSSWPLFGGTVGILYEQAGVSGSRVSRHDGTVLTYSEAVKHHYVSSLANLGTASLNRKKLLGDFNAYRRKAIETFGGGPARAFLVRPGANRDKLDHLARTLMRQGIEVAKASERFSASAHDYFSTKNTSQTFEEGTMVIRADQPLGYLVQAILSFDTRLPDSFLVEERRELLKHRSTRLYEVTSWSLLEAYGVDAYESDSRAGGSLAPWTFAEQKGNVLGTAPRQGFLFETGNDRALRAMAELFREGITMYATNRDLDWEGQSFARGSIFVPRRANSEGYEVIVRTVANNTGITVFPVNSGQGSVGPDIGGEYLNVLRKPTIAIVAGGATRFDGAGWIWHLLDQKIGIPVSLLDIAQLGFTDLDIYNVLILPPGWGGYARVLGKPTLEHLKQWVEAGGTLIAMENAAAFVADSSSALSAVRPREQILDKLDAYVESIDDQVNAEQPSLDGVHPWNPPEKRAAQKEKNSAAEPPSLKELKRSEDLGQLFSPRGAILRVELDQEEWITAGLPPSLPVIMTSPTVLLAQYPPVRTVGRFADSDQIRVSGLLWPEARARLARSAYCTREQQGKGQVILFADQPNFRAFFRGAERLLVNAVLLGPGLGTTWTPAP